MFDRSRTDNLPEPYPVPVEIGTTEGQVAKGKLFVPSGRTLSDLLNGGAAFVEFEPYGGDRHFVAKSQLVSVRPVAVPRAPDLKARSREHDTFDPHTVLGVAHSAQWDEIRAAYHRLAKVYHPDRYASAALPSEVVEYLLAMARRINAAYAALQPARQAGSPGAARCAAAYTG